MRISFPELISETDNPTFDKQDNDYFISLFVRDFKDVVSRREDFIIPNLGRFGIRKFRLFITEELEKEHPDILCASRELRDELFPMKIQEILSIRENLTDKKLAHRMRQILKSVKPLHKH
jgi:hypothetical protein